MSNDSPEHTRGGTEINRRTVLKAAAVAGATSGAGTAGAAGDAGEAPGAARSETDVTRSEERVTRTKREYFTGVREAVFLDFEDLPEASSDVQVDVEVVGDFGVDTVEYCFFRCYEYIVGYDYGYVYADRNELGTIGRYNYDEGCTSSRETYTVPKSMVSDGELRIKIDNNRNVDYDGCRAASWATVTISYVPGGNEAPDADAGGDYTVAEGDSVTLDGSGSTDPDGDDLTYEWDFDDDGAFDDATGPSPTFDAASMDGPAERTVRLRVTDGGGESDTDAATVSVTNAAPSITVDDDAVSVEEGDTATNGGSLSDPGGDGLSVSASVGSATTDGSGGWTWEYPTTDGPAQGGTVTVTAEDDDGATAQASFDLTVENVAPSVDATGDAIDEGSAATVSATFTDPGIEDTHTAEIDWADGTVESVPVDQGSGEGSLEASHTYLDDGDYEVTVSVTDDDGGTGTDTATVEVANVAPSVSAAGDSIDEGSAATVTAEFTDPSPVDTHTATVDWGDGSSGDVPVDQGEGEGSLEATHEYVEDGDYEVTVAVTDDDGGTGTDTATVEVANVAPSVSATGDAIDEGEAATVSATFTDPGIRDTHTAEIDWADGTVESVPVDQGEGEGSLEASHVYGDDGTYEVTVAVTDDDGGTGTDTVTVAVANLPPEATLDTTDAVTFPSGETAFLGVSGTEQSHGAEATDPGSDDLTFAWSFGAEETYYNDGSPDPDESPHGTFPFSASDTASVTFSSPGEREIAVTVSDDDGGSDEDSLDALVRGGAGDTRGSGFWRHQFSGRGRAHYSDPTLEAFLSMANYASGVFSEVTDAGSFDAAFDVLHPGRGGNGDRGERGGDERGGNEDRGERGGGGRMRDLATAQALAAWLNFAAGGVGWTESVRVRPGGDEDGGSTVTTRRFADLMADVESILRDSEATRQELERAKRLAESVNVGGEEDGDDENEGGDEGSEGRRGGNGRGSGD